MTPDIVFSHMSIPDPKIKCLDSNLAEAQGLQPQRRAGGYQGVHGAGNVVEKTPAYQPLSFDWLGVPPPEIPLLDMHEIIGEKIRAAAQRIRVRDLYDLYQLSSQHFDREVVRRIAVIKCWETNFALDPVAFLERIGSGQYDWADLHRLVRRGWEIPPETIMRGVQQGYAFITGLTAEEHVLAGDPYRRQKQTYRLLVESLQKE